MSENKTKTVEQAQESVESKAKTLVDKVLLLLGDADFKAVFAIAQAHNYQYRGPELFNELNDLRYALNELQKAKETAPKAEENPVVDVAANVVPFEPKA